MVLIKTLNNRCINSNKWPHLADSKMVHHKVLLVRQVSLQWECVSLFLWLDHHLLVNLRIWDQVNTHKLVRNNTFHLQICEADLHHKEACIQECMHQVTQAVLQAVIQCKISGLTATQFHNSIVLTQMLLKVQITIQDYQIINNKIIKTQQKSRDKLKPKD